VGHLVGARSKDFNRKERQGGAKIAKGKPNANLPFATFAPPWRTLRLEALFWFFSVSSVGYML
jgi:hypothetical protein